MRPFQKKIAEQMRDVPLDQITMQRFGLPASALVQVFSIGARVHSGQACTRADCAALARVFPNVDPRVIEQRLVQLNALQKSHGPATAFSFFLREAAGPKAAEARTFFERFAHNAVSGEMIERGLRRDAEQDKRRGIDAARAPDPREQARQADNAHRRAIIEREMSKRYPEPDRFAHADRMEVAAHVLHSGRPTSVRDTVRAAYASHEALEYGKEAGILGESQGIPSSHGPIGGDTSSDASQVEAPAAEAPSQ